MGFIIFWTSFYFILLLLFYFKFSFNFLFYFILSFHFISFHFISFYMKEGTERSPKETHNAQGAPTEMRHKGQKPPKPNTS